MEQSKACCPVCTLYLRDGMTLQDHLETHPKDKVIEALLKATNGGTTTQAAPPQPASGSAPVDTFMSPQQYAPPGAAFMSQTQNYMNPQTQMTSAVTYQQYVTSNGSTVMPHYIQVPTIVAPNQALNYVPNQPNAYAHTMYNPLYNPYIPQPYPLVQPLYTTIPVTSESNTQVSTSQMTTSIAPVQTGESSVLENPDSGEKQVSTIATNTSSHRDTTLRSRLRKLPIRSSTQTKFRIIKQLGSRSKTTTSTMATLGTKSYRITSINSKTNSTAKTSVITKARSFRKPRPLLPKPAPAPTSRIISPPPLTPMTTSGSKNVSCSETPPPPPLSKAPCLTPIPSTFELPSIKTERPSYSGDSESKSDIIKKDCTSVDDVADYVLGRHEVPSVNSVIVESNCAIQITSNIVISNSVSEERVNESSSFEDETILPQEVVERSSVGKESEFSEERKFTMERDEESDNDRNADSDYDEDDEQLQEKVFHSLEIEEEKKVAFNFDLDNQDIPKEISSANIEKTCDGCDIFIQEESIPYSRDENTVNKTRSLTDSSANGSGGSAPREKGDTVSEPKTAEEKSGETVSQIAERGLSTDLKTLTYTDLQPATNTKVLQDLGIATSINLNNYMEIDGIRIFFNNTGPQTMPLEPIIKFTSSMKSDVQNFMKTENSVKESDSLVDSVIQLVSGRTPQKASDYTADTGSHPSDGHLDLRDLSPLTLNIQADESMPARGELSEQESLGAENSNWGMFHSESTSMKTPQVWKTDEDVQLTSVKQSESTRSSKKFKCSLCGEVFSCPKDRRMHRSTVHIVHDKPATPRKPKTFVCNHCKQPFTSLRDKRRHILQNHFFDSNKVKIEFDGKDENTPKTEGLSIPDSETPVKQEEGEARVKCESSVPTQANKAPCEITKTCPRCGLPLSGLKKLREHMKEAHGESKYKCGTCSEIFESERDYNSHLRIHPLICDQCGKMFNRKPNLKLHMRRHLIVKPYICTSCPKSFITRQKLDEHMNGHSGNKPLKCSMCDSTFSRHSNLIQHRNIHHLLGKKKVKDFVCRCGEVFHSLRKLLWHKEVHDTKPKTCPFCSQKFIHSNSVTRHIRRSHMPDYLPDYKKYNENVQCPICEKIYLRSSLIVHMRVHNGEKPFVCKICNRKFTTKWNLELHNWTHQSRNNMPFKCNICKSAFFREVDYVAHLNSHRNHRPFTCNICGQKFIRKYNCLRHQEEHKKEKKFVCTVTGCEKSFHRSYYLKDHMRVHTGIRPHTCHICGKASSTKSNHNKHVRIHDTREPVNTEN